MFLSGYIDRELGKFQSVMVYAHILNKIPFLEYGINIIFFMIVNLTFYSCSMLLQIFSQISFFSEYSIRILSSIVSITRLLLLHVREKCEVFSDGIGITFSRSRVPRPVNSMDSMCP